MKTFIQYSISVRDKLIPYYIFSSREIKLQSDLRDEEIVAEVRQDFPHALYEEGINTKSSNFISACVSGIKVSRIIPYEDIKIEITN